MSFSNFDDPHFFDDPEFDNDPDFADDEDLDDDFDIDIDIDDDEDSDIDIDLNFPIDSSIEDSHADLHDAMKEALMSSFNMDNLKETMNSVFGKRDELVSKIKESSSVTQSGNQTVVELKIPGYTRDQISVYFDKDTLNVEAIRQGGHQKMGGNSISQSRSQSVYRTSVYVKAMNNPTMEATYENDILKVTFTE